VFSNSFFSTENRTFYEIMLKNMVEPERSRMAKKFRSACWLTKARIQTHNHNI